MSPLPRRTVWVESLQKTFAGAVIVGGVKLITAQIERMGEMVKETATSAQKSFDDIEKAGQAMSFEDALSQTNSLSQNIEQIRNKLAELDRSPFQNFIAGATGAREQVEGLLEAQERLRAAKLAEGLASENERNAALQGLSAEEKQLFEINEEYEKRIKQINETMADQPGMAASAKEDAGEIMARKRNEVLDKKAAKAADQQSKIDADLAKKEADYERELFQAEMEAAKFERETKEKLDKEIADQEAEYQKELFQAEMEAAKFERETKENINKELEEAAKMAKAAPRLIQQAQGEPLLKH
jgi:chromosome segregation ATPase